MNTFEIKNSILRRWVKDFAGNDIHSCDFVMLAPFACFLKNEDGNLVLDMTKHPLFFTRKKWNRAFRLKLQDFYESRFWQKGVVGQSSFSIHGAGESFGRVVSSFALVEYFTLDDGIEPVMYSYRGMSNRFARLSSEVAASYVKVEPDDFIRMKLRFSYLKQDEEDVKQELQKLFSLRDAEISDCCIETGLTAFKGWQFFSKALSRARQHESWMKRSGEFANLVVRDRSLKLDKLSDLFDEIYYKSGPLTVDCEHPLKDHFEQVFHRD